MRILYGRIASIALAVVFTVMAASHVAATGCGDIIVGEGDTILSCDFTHEDEEACYYDCTCEGDWEECDRIARDHGLEDA
ncbi:MAG: hypothetical protein ACRD5H_04590 [Nitrososphaerales archaeon]